MAIRRQPFDNAGKADREISQVHYAIGGENQVVLRSWTRQFGFEIAEYEFAIDSARACRFKHARGQVYAVDCPSFGKIAEGYGGQPRAAAKIQNLLR